jgi:hypothetical protein
MEGEAHLLGQPPKPGKRAVVVDFGLGDRPDTTLELLDALRAVAPHLHVIGIDHDGDRVDAARMLAPELDVRLGDLGFAREPDDEIRLIRAMNVLRQGEEDGALKAHQILGANLIEGGLLIEGSSDLAGGVLVAHLLRRRDGQTRREAMAFATDFSRGFSPLLFRDWLPRDLRRRMKEGEGIHTFLSDWNNAFEQIRRGQTRHSKGLFLESIVALGKKLGSDLDARWASWGLLIWRPKGGVPYPSRLWGSGSHT